MRTAVFKAVIRISHVVAVDQIRITCIRYDRIVRLGVLSMIRKLMLASAVVAATAAAVISPADASGWYYHGPHGGYAWGYHGGYGYHGWGYHGCCYGGGAVAAGAAAGVVAGAAIGAAAARPAYVIPPVVYAPPRVVYAAPPVVYAPPAYYVR
jgi:hypothetical protein